MAVRFSTGQIKIKRGVSGVCRLKGPRKGKGSAKWLSLEKGLDSCDSSDSTNTAGSTGTAGVLMHLVTAPRECG